MYVTAKHGTHYAVIYDGVSENGVEKRRWVRLASMNLEEARMEARLRWPDGRVPPGPPARIRLQAWVDQWLPVKRNELLYSTLVTYEVNLAKYILPALGGRYLDEIRSWDIRLFHSSLADRLGQYGPLSMKTRLEITLLLKLVLKDAVLAGVATDDPGLGVKVPKGPRPEIVPLEDAQALALLERTRGTWIHPAVLLGLLGGLRLGEVRALLWRDIDFDACIVRVNKAMTKERRGEIVGSPKTGRGFRTIDMNPWVIDELRVLRDRVATSEPDASARPVVVGPLSHKRVRSGQLYKVYRRHAMAMGVSTRFHDLRHTHASQLLRAGVSIKVISERLGHASEAFTLRTYIHLLPGETRQAIRKLDTIYPEKKTA